MRYVLPVSELTAMAGALFLNALLYALPSERGRSVYTHSLSIHRIRVVYRVSSCVAYTCGVSSTRGGKRLKQSADCFKSLPSVCCVAPADDHLGHAIIYMIITVRLQGATEELAPSDQLDTATAQHKSSILQ